jgi:hypothetical protein
LKLNPFIVNQGGPFAVFRRHLPPFWPSRRLFSVFLTFAAFCRLSIILNNFINFSYFWPKFPIKSEKFQGKRVRIFKKIFAAAPIGAASK